MKKFSAIFLIGLMLILTACATSAGAATPAEPTATPGIVAENYANALPVPSQLALGTINLKGTANAVTADQAANLLFLWKGMQALGTASNSSQLEMNALLLQIQDAMKPTQLQAIADLKLSQADVQKAMAELGPAAPGGASRAAGTGTGSTNGNNRNQQGGGNFQAFGGPGGGGAIPGGQGGGGNQAIPPSTQATIQARAAQQSTRGNTLLYTAVVTYLQTLVTTK
jgi:hypothetical protein